MANSVLDTNRRFSKNFYHSDKILQHYLNTRLSARNLAYMNDKLHLLGTLAATEMNDLSLDADKNGPVLKKRNFYGENIDEIIFHPAYKRLTEIAVESEIFRLKWEPELRKRFEGERNRLSFAAGFLFAMSESGLYCPLCMTDGVALLIDKYCSETDKERLLPKIYTEKAYELFTGAMFLTEKSGGSDVGANLVTAVHKEGDRWLLEGEKWFCSNANADIIFILARTNPDIKGTRGLGIFLMEPKLPDGSKNKFELVRLKDKLGTRSMASGEYILNKAEASLVGGETEGFKIMTDMINLSRLYNSIAAISGLRRGIIEAYQFLSFRKTFGKNALEHPLIRLKLEELSVLYIGNFYLCWRAIEALDAIESGNLEEVELLRLITPMSKKSTAEAAVYGVRESMELMGGMGYIEDGVMPKIMRDVMVLPIWEGAGNIMIMDMLRASHKSDGLKIMFSEMENIFTEWANNDASHADKWEKLLVKTKSLHALFLELFQSEKDVMEASSKSAFERLTELYQLYCLLRYFDDDSKEWIEPASYYLLNKITSAYPTLTSPPDSKQIEALIAWTF